MRISLALLMLFFCGVVAGESPLEKFKCEGEDFKLKVGEQLTYTIYWIGLPVGRGIMRVKELTKEKGRTAYQLTIQVRSNRLIRWIYKVEDDASSMIEVDGFRPLRFDKHLHEGKRKKDELIDFDWEKEEATYYKIREEKQQKRRSFVMEKGAQDPLSCLYFLRSFSLEAGKERIMKVASEKKCWDLKIVPLRKEKLELEGLGTFDCLVIEPIAEFEGLFVRSDKKLTIWLDEKTGIVLKMVAEIPIGSASVYLADVADVEADPDKAIDLPRSGPTVSRREPEREKKAGKIPWKKLTGQKENTRRRADRRGG
jgi:hypothetical protein